MNNYTVFSNSDMHILDTCLHSLLHVPQIKDARKEELKIIRNKIRVLDSTSEKEPIYDDTYGNIDSALHLTSYEWATVAGALDLVRKNAVGWPEEELKQIDQIQWKLSNQKENEN